MEILAVYKSRIIINLDLTLTVRQRILMQVEYLCTENNSSNIIKIVTHELSFYSFSWCFAHPSTTPLGSKLGDFMLVFVISGDVSAGYKLLESCAGRNTMFM